WHFGRVGLRVEEVWLDDFDAMSFIRVMVLDGGYGVLGRVGARSGLRGRGLSDFRFTVLLVGMLFYLAWACVTLPGLAVACGLRRPPHPNPLPKGEREEGA